MRDQWRLADERNGFSYHLDASRPWSGRARAEVPRGEGSGSFMALGELRQD
jgi:hypothetical protein